MSDRYDDLHRMSIEDPERFWGEAASAIDWFKPWDSVLDPDNAEFPRRWFRGAETNTCYNALDRHVKAGRGDQVAIYYDSPITDSKAAITYAELLDQTPRVTG
jgi:propionyl-CoA synthetase